MSPGSANSSSISMSMMPIWAFFVASSSCFSSSSIFSSSSLTSSASGIGHRRAAGELVLGGQLIDLVLVAQRSTQLHELAGELATLVAGRIPQPFQVAKLLLLNGLLEAARAASAAARSCSPLSEIPCAASPCTASVSYFARIFRFRSSSIAMSASRLGPRPAIWLGSRWTARASSSSVSSRVLAEHQHVLHRRRDQVRRRLRRAGKLTGSYFWYV